MAVWRTAAAYLGEAASPEWFEPLRDFIWGAHTHSDRLGYTFDAICSAQTSIGYIAASSPQALRYLIQSTSPAYWDSLPWRSPRMNDRDLRLALSEASIQALGLSGASEAGQMLYRLRQSPYREAQRDAIEEAIKRHRWSSLVRKYYQAALRHLSLLHFRELLAPTTDSIPILGGWRWMRSSGAWVGDFAPPACGWSRTLILSSDGTYSFWEEDSVASYRICRGRFALHESGDPAKGSWIELQGWSWGGPGTYWLRFAGPDLLKLFPGDARGLWRDIGFSHTFVREPRGSALPDSTHAGEWRPPRVRRAIQSNSYSIEAPSALQAILDGMGVRRWELRPSTSLVPKRYQCNQQQVPSGVIGDFDGDSLADVAIYGYDGNGRNTIACALSNRGSPRGAVAWLEPGGPRRKGTTSWPSLYMELCPAGRSLVGSDGIPIVLKTDGIYTISARGEKSILYYADGGFHQGKPAPATSER